MGCNKSRTAQAPAPAGVKCVRDGCSFQKHTSQPHGYCCNLCKMQGDHGPLCERRAHAGAPATPAAAAAAAPVPKPVVTDRVKLRWTPSLLFGPNGVGLSPECNVSATETMHIEPHRGELFASYGMWCSPSDIKKEREKNPFICRLASGGGQWTVDMRGQGSSKYAMRITCLKSVTFSRDSEGKEIQPVQLLTACYSLGAHGNCMMFRVDGDSSAPGTQYRWEECNYTGKRSDPNGSGTARAVVVHRDAVTGIFALQGFSGVISGLYDPRCNAPGKVRWDADTEKLDLSAVGDGKATKLPFRPLSLVICNGRLFMSAASLILERSDGPNPVWKGIIDIAKCRHDGKLDEAVGGIRGMTTVPSSDSSSSSILFCWNPNGSSKSWILRSDFENGKLKPPVEETSINQEAKRYLGTEDLHYTLAAYNNMLPVRLGNHSVNLIGFEIVVAGNTFHQRQLPLDQEKPKHGYWAGAGITCRVAGNDYFTIEVGGRGGTGRKLTAVRCFANSPFPDDPNAVYFGGYDCNSAPSEHTAWVYKCQPA